MRFDQLKRREFVTLLGGGAAWPLAARAQQPERIRRIGVLMGYPKNDLEGPAFFAAFREGLEKLGWVEDRNIRFDTRWATPEDAEARQRFAKELVALQPDLILSAVTPTTAALLEQTRTIPIVFATVSDPVGSGFVASVARPGGNATGVHQLNTALGGKQLGVLRELVPSAARVGLLVNPNNSNAEVMTKEVTTAASAIGVEIGVTRASDRSEIEAAFATLVRNRADALVVGADSFFFGRRLQLTTLATRHAIPAIYNAREYSEAGGLMSYGASLTEVYRYLGTYTVRILNGDKPADLPVVQSTKLELVINHETARILGLTVPPTLLARADEVIE
jgi:putative ABC transport system substrate-binding protein